MLWVGKGIEEEWFQGLSALLTPWIQLGIFYKLALHLQNSIFGCFLTTLWLIVNRLARSAADLILKLMRWRALPSLNLDVLSSARCLLLGAGTLGCLVCSNAYGYICALWLKFYHLFGLIIESLYLESHCLLCIIFVCTSLFSHLVLVLLNNGCFIEGCKKLPGKKISQGLTKEQE